MTATAPGPEPTGETSGTAGGPAAQAPEISPAATAARPSGTARGWLRTRKAIAALLLTVRLAGGAPGYRPASRRQPHDR
jgi:hypothetical protein